MNGRKPHESRRRLTTMAGTVALLLSSVGMAANTVAGGVGGAGGGAGGSGGAAGGSGGAASIGNTGGSAGSDRGAVSGGSRAGVYGPARNAARRGDSNVAPRNSGDDTGIESQNNNDQGFTRREQDGRRGDVNPTNGRRDNPSLRRDRLDNARDRLDSAREGDGSLDPQVDQTRLQGGRTDTFTSSDSDRDNRLSEEEFQDFRRRNDDGGGDGQSFSDLDRDNDNELTIDDATRNSNER